MAYTDHYLRAATEADLKAALPWAVDGEGEWITGGKTYALDLIGGVVTEPGTYDEDGNELTAPVIDDRFHANLHANADFAEDVSGVEITAPATPTRVWA